MKWQSPTWFWLLLLIPVLLLYFIGRKRADARSLEKLVESQLWPRMIPERKSSVFYLKSALLLLGFFWLILSLARPQWGFHEEKITQTGIDILLILDLSSSMEAEDVVPSRLKKAKHFLRNFIGSLKGDRVGLVGFAGSSFLASPLTTDTTYVQEILEILETTTLQNQGTDIGLGLQTAAQALDRAAEVSGSEESQAEQSRAVVLISDGEDLEGGAIEGAKQIKKTGAQFFVVGVGTEKGKPIPVRDANGYLTGYKKDSSGQPIISTFHPEALQELAKKSDGLFYRLTEHESEVSEILNQLGRAHATDHEERISKVFIERFQFPLFLALVFLMADLIIVVRNRRAMVTILLLWGVFNSQMSAAKEPQLQTYQDNKHGVKAITEGKVDEARKWFGSAQSREPDQPALRYNQGLVEALQGNLDSASGIFGEVSQLPENKKGDQKLIDRSLYNLGSVLEKQGKMEDAVKAFSGAARHAEAAGDLGLAQDARLRIQAIAVKQKQKKQQKQKEDEGKSGDNQSGKDKQSEQEDPGKKKDEKKSTPQTYSNKQQYRSEAISKDDAEKVMEELSGKEKQLKMRLKKSEYGKKQGKGKDW